MIATSRVISFMTSQSTLLWNIFFTFPIMNQNEWQTLPINGSTWRYLWTLWNVKNVSRKTLLTMFQVALSTTRFVFKNLSKYLSPCLHLHNSPQLVCFCAVFFLIRNHIVRGQFSPYSSPEWEMAQASSSIINNSAVSRLNLQIITSHSARHFWSALNQSGSIWKWLRV